MARRPSPNNGPANPALGRFEEAVKDFRARLAVSDETWRGMSEEARQRAFKVAGVAQLDVVSKVWKALDKAVADGETLADFKKRIGAELKREWAGSVRNPGARLETIFRTNVQTAYSRGTWAQLQNPDTRRIRPYIKSVPILGDGRTSPICRTIGVVILPAGHSWWLTHWSPLHFSCRRTQTALTEKQAKAQGVTQAPPLQAAAPGFGRAPGMGGEWQPDVADAPQPLRTVYEAKPQQPEAPPPAVESAPTLPHGPIRGDSAEAVLKEHPELVAAMGDTLRVDGYLTDSKTFRMVADMAALPPKLLEAVRKATTDIHISGVHTMPDMGRSGAAKQLRAQSRGRSGGTWEIASGVYLPGSNKGKRIAEVLVTRHPGGSVSSIVHELGHAFDMADAKHWLSKKPAYLAAWESFRRGSGTKTGVSYYTNDEIGPQEAFAEAFAVLWTAGGRDYGRDLLAEQFGPEMADYMAGEYGWQQWRD